MLKNKKTEKNTETRPPVVVIMGHIDHGKSTLLDYIRKTNVVDKETGGITQKLSAYEVVHKTKGGPEKRITFLDTPGHSIFSGMRLRSAKVADIAVLMVSAEEGVKPQTKEAYELIKDAEVPYVIAINKIDKPNANIETTKQSLAKIGILVEGYGGDVPYVAISAKSGKGVDELLDMVLLLADLEELVGEKDKEAQGIVIESHLDNKKGISATLIIKDGTLKTGMYVTAQESVSVVRIFENFLGKPIKEASFSSPVKVTGWSILPKVGSTFTSHISKKLAIENVDMNTKTTSQKEGGVQTRFVKSDEMNTLPIIIKADVAGMVEVIEKEIEKIKTAGITIKVIHTGTGDITENDVKLASGATSPIIIGFNVRINATSKDLAQRTGVDVQIFEIIYKLTEWLEKEVSERVPKILVESTLGKAKIIRVFSKSKNKQVAGGKVSEGSLKTKTKIRIARRGEKIGDGEILELQKQKIVTDNVDAGSEFGVMINSSVEIANGDTIEAFTLVEK